MTALVLKNVQALIGSFDASGQSNEATMQVTLDELETTTFGSNGWREYVAGNGDTKGSVKGNWSSSVDNLAFTGIGVAGTPMSIIAQGGTIGNVAYTVKTLQSSYNQGDKVGTIAPFDLSFSGVGIPVRGALLHSSGTAATVTGTATGVNLGAVPAGQAVYAALHVTAATGTSPSLTVTIESDTSSSFPAPVTVGAFTAVTATGSQWESFAAPVSSDIYYRVSYTIAGTSPSFQFAVVVGFA